MSVGDALDEPELALSPEPELMVPLSVQVVGVDPAAAAEPAPAEADEPEVAAEIWIVSRVFGTE